MLKRSSYSLNVEAFKSTDFKEEATTTTAITPQTNLIVTDNFPSSEYEVTVSYSYGAEDIGAIYYADVQVDGVSLGQTHIEEIKNTLGHTPTYRRLKTTLNGEHTLSLRFWSGDTQNTVEMADAVMTVEAI